MIPLITSHGTADKIIGFDGRDNDSGKHEKLPKITTWRTQWAERNGCSSNELSDPKVTHPFKNATRTDWSCGVSAVTVKGLGHSWPDVDGADTAGRPNNHADFDFTPDMLLPFFSQHALG